jgi:hypothetical protein
VRQGCDHNMALARRLSLMTMMRLADLAVRKLGISPHKGSTLVSSQTAEALSLGPDDIMVAELEVNHEDSLTSLL